MVVGIGEPICRQSGLLVFFERLAPVVRGSGWFLVLRGVRARKVLHY